MYPKRAVVLMVLVCFALASPAWAAQEGSTMDTEVKALLEQHDKAFSDHDVKGVMATYASGSELVLMGTGPGEVYAGKEGIENAYSQFFTKFDAGTLKVDYEWISAHSKGDVAWFAAESRASATVKGEKKELGFNTSGTLVKEGGKWRFVALHFSRLGAGQ